MKFLANENFPAASISSLRSNEIDIVAIAEHNHGISDKAVMGISIEQDQL